MNSMFCKCSSLKLIDISSFNTSSVECMNDMFKDCSKLTSLDLSNFNLESIFIMNSMFYGCHKLKFINFYNYKEDSLNKLIDFFYDTPKDLIICINKGTNLNLLTYHLIFQKCFITECKFEQYTKKNNI